MLKLFKNNFGSKIGIIYYSWIKNDPDGPELVFLSNSKESFDKYHNKLRKKYGSIELPDKELEGIKEAVLKYLEGNDSIPVIKHTFLTGSDFDKHIWQVTSAIPYGCVMTYREVAQKAGYPNAYRAAGTALGKNPLMLIIGCHRVIKSSGKAGFFGGGEKIKKLLLRMESKS